MIFTLSFTVQKICAMASNEKVFIEPADSVSTKVSGNSDSNATETMPLVVRSSTVKRSGLLGRLGESLLIKSKAANTILVWNTLVYLIYGFVLNPDIIFTIPIYQLSDPSTYVSSPDQYRPSIFSSGYIAFMNVIGSGVYGFIAVWLLFYPLAGYLADVHYGRYKVAVSFGLRIMWIAVMVLIIGGSVVNIIFWPIYSFSDQVWYYGGFDPLILYLAISVAIAFTAYCMWSVGFTAFAANVIQFGIDQLRDLPARDSFLFIHWLLLTQFIGVSIGKIAWSISGATFFISLSALGLFILIFVIVVPLSLCIAKSRWFISTRDTGLGNPYREVA